LSFTIDIIEGKFLVNLARNAVLKKITVGDTIKPPLNSSRKLFERAGVFVTLNTVKNGNKKLRGCIGYPYPTHLLVEAIIDSAINAAVHDPRFLPLTINEINNVVFEVSVLTPPKIIEINDPKEVTKKITIGQDGLIVERGPYKGLLLPQVPIEWGWNLEEFVSQCCIKAGLPSDSWKSKQTKIYTFQAIIFEEKTPRGDIIKKALI
jgi:uncharacterized protein (TIGR00296 family)